VVSKLDDAARELELEIGAKRSAIFEKFAAEQGAPGAPSSTLGRWMTQMAMRRAMMGAAGGAYGATGEGGAAGALKGMAVGAVIGHYSGGVTRRVAQAVGKGKAAARRAGRTRVARTGREIGKRAARAAILRGAAATAFNMQTIADADPGRLEEMARQTAEQTALVFGLPQSIQEEAVQRNLAALEFLQSKVPQR
jgi:hypothetical protein